MLSKLIFYLVIKPLSLLPLRVLYVLSDLLYLILYKVIRYRTDVVSLNLRNSFPDKSEKEIKAISNKFYKHLMDLIVESVKLFSISEQEAIKRMKFLNPEALDKYANDNQSVLIVGGHYNSWELVAMAINSQTKLQVVGLYTKLSNDFFNNVMLESRTRYGTRMVTTKDASRFFVNDSANNTATLFGADQSPTHNKNVIWTRFLNQDTAIAFGTERYAKKYNYPVLYGSMEKVKRGYYTFEISTITDNPGDTEHGYISKAHTRLLEQQIEREPAYWLWTHKRWKRKRNADEKLL